MYKHIAIDCSSLLFGPAFKMKKLKANEIKTGAMFGFFKSMLFLAQTFHSNKFIFCWDNKESDRRKLFPEYKIGRGKKRKEDPAMDDIYQAVIKQSDMLRYDILPSIGFVNSFAQDGKEADDILAILVLHYEDILMVSNDEDMFQMLDLCDIWNNNKGVLWSERSFTSKYGIKAPEWADVKSIAGCTSDEVPGIQGVGNTTAIKYLLGNMNHDTITYKNIYAGKDTIERNRKLVTLPIEGTKPVCLKKDKLDYHAFLDVCRTYNFNSFLDQRDIDWENFFRGRV